MRNAVLRIHKNLRHPSKDQLVRAFRACGASDEAIAAAVQLQCPVCHEMNRPAVGHTRFPARLKKVKEFGEQIAIDLFTVHTNSGVALEMLNIVDIKTGFQVVAPIKSKHPGIVAQALELVWFSWAGVPNSLVCDNGGEFYKEVFRLLEGCGVQVWFTAVEAPWQNGMCERAGGEWKVLWKASTTEADIETELEVTAAAVMITWAKNQRINESGFSPAQLVLGRSQTLPWSLLSERGRSQIAAHDAVDNDPIHDEAAAGLQRCAGGP